MKELQQSRLEVLDTFRGFAALFVLFFHFSMFRSQSEYGFFLGISGVDLFFIISGFVIFLSIDRRKNGRVFLLLRFFRLYPLYWVIATFTFSLFYILNLFDGLIPDVEIPFRTYLVNLSMIQYYFDVPNIDGSYWTLIIELLFYVFIYLFYRLGLLKNIVLIGFIFCVFIFLISVGINYFKWKDFTNYFPLLYHFPMFFMGILFYKIYLSKQFQWKYFLIIICCVLLQLYLANYGRSIQFMSINSYAIILFVYATIFYLFVFDKLNWVVTPLTSFFGDISYSLYLIHQPLCYGILIPYLTDVLKVNFWISSFLISLPIVIGLAAFFTFKVEKPLLIYCRSKLISRKIL
jgi:peptidoglycan/LPS O-acetylase OafA/YrhL